MTAFGAPPMARGNNAPSIGLSRLDRPSAARFDILADGAVRIVLPAGGVLTDAEAKRLAWGLLADLAPDEVIQTADVVTYKEAQRLAILRAVAAGHTTSRALATALDWGRRIIQRRTAELVGDGRLKALGLPQAPDRAFALNYTGADQ